MKVKALETPYIKPFEARQPSESVKKLADHVKVSKFKPPKKVKKNNITPVGQTWFRITVVRTS